MSKHRLDARQMLCPLPVIRVQDRITHLAIGDCLEVLCTDPGALIDIPAWCRVHGHQVLETRSNGPELSITIEIRAAHQETAGRNSR